MAVREKIPVEAHVEWAAMEMGDDGVWHVPGWSVTGIELIPGRSAAGMELVEVRISPDLLNHADLGPADTLRGKIVRAFFRLL